MSVNECSKRSEKPEMIPRGCIAIDMQSCPAHQKLAKIFFITGIVEE